MAGSTKETFGNNSSPECCPMPEGGCVTILEEYADAVRLLHRMRDATGEGEYARAQHWFMPVDKFSADFFCSAEHPRFGWYGLMADVSGHGLVASLFALNVPLIFRESVLLGMSLPAIYERIGRFLTHQHIGGYFVSGILVRVLGREIEVINAGMPEALLFADEGGLREAFLSRQLPFGVLGDEAELLCVPQRYRLARDERAALLMYSDGLSELGILGGRALGREGILACADQGMERIFDRLVDRVGHCMEDIHDDVSIVLVPLPLSLSKGNEVVDDKDWGSGTEVELADLSPHVPAVMRIIENLDHGLILTDADQRILYVNPAFTAITGYSFEESMGQTPRLLNSGRHDQQFYREMQQTLAQEGSWFGEIWNRRKDGSIYVEWLDIQVIRDETGQIKNYLATFTDIMRKREREGRLQFLALHDPLTGLANRTLLNDRGQQAIRHAERTESALAVLFLDLDRFKSINDSLGHDIGDEVLVCVAQRLSEAMREGDTLARFGGDQFICLLPDIQDRQDALLVASKLLNALVEPIDVAGHQFKVGASIGVSAYPSDSLFLDDLIVEADRAMLRAKQAGGNLVRFFTAEMSAKMDRQLEIEARLDAAISAGNLVLYYQPKVDLVSRKIVGAEALVRWRDPQQGLIPPGEFIPVAERSYLIARIGHWVLWEVCGMLLRRDSNLPSGFHVAVNVSAKQFDRGDLAHEVAEAIGTTGVEPGRLQIEVTESLIVQDPERVAAVLQRIADMGVSVVLDDFGTGYSNLASLSRLPIDTFKLDQSFVRGIDVNAVNASIARSVWHLADGLDRKVVAEGIESCAECGIVRRMGYQIGQGFLFGKPMPEDEFFIHAESWDPETYSCNLFPEQDGR